jgi:hypothetical protein
MALEAVGFAIGGPPAIAAFIATAGRMLSFVAAEPGLIQRMPTVFGGLCAAGLTPSMALAGQAVASLAVVVLVCHIWRTSRDTLRRALAWAAGVPLAAPYLFDYELAIFAVPLAFFLAPRAPRIGLIEVGVVTLLWTMGVLVAPIAAVLGQQLGALAAVVLLSYALAKNAETGR